MTENHDYNTPEEGTVDWHVPLNENFERLDADVEVRDAASNISDYTPRDGAKFFATDTGETYLGDGSSWNAVPSPTSSENTSFDSVSTGQLNDTVMVSPAEGGDGINAAMAPNRRIKLRRGTYEVTSTIGLEDGVILEGEGKGATVLQAAPGFTDSVIDQGSNNAEGVQIRHLTVDGNVENDSTFVGIRFHKDSGDGSTVAHCEIKNMDFEGIHPVSARDFRILYCDVNDNGNGNGSGDNGILCGSEGGMLIHGCTAIGNEKFGIGVEGQNFTISDCHVEDSGGPNINVENAHNSFVTNFRAFESRGGNGNVLVQAGSTNVVLAGGHVRQTETPRNAVRTTPVAGPIENITFRDMTVVSRSDSNGFQFRGNSSHDTHQCRVIDSRVIDAGRGIYLTGGGGGTNRDFSARGNTFTDCGTDIDTGVSERAVINGWGTNAGSPSNGGEWNGHGRPGVTVRDTNGGDSYVYLDGGWARL